MANQLTERGSQSGRNRERERESARENAHAQKRPTKETYKNAKETYKRDLQKRTHIYAHVHRWENAHTTLTNESRTNVLTLPMC